MFFKKEAKVEEDETYRIDGENVVFSLEDLDFTFESFKMRIGDSFQLIIEDEAAMNISHLAPVIEGMGEIDINPMSDATVDFTIELNEYLFNQLKQQFLKAEKPEDIFNLNQEETDILTDLNNYNLVSYNIND